MRIHRVISLLFSFFFAAFVMAQQPLPDRWCGYTGKSPWLEEYQRQAHEQVRARGTDTTWLYVPVTLQIVGTNEGVGYFPLDDAIRAVCGMNERFAEARVRYYLKPGDMVRYLNNSDWYDHDFGGGYQLITQNKLPNRLNAFVVSNPAGNCGYAWHDAIVLGSGCSSADNTTWAHEAGHHLSLPHTFSGWENFDWNYNEPAPEMIDDHFVEKADSSNCDFAGDGFCDTPSDYLNDRWDCNSVFQSTKIQHDPNGESFRSDGNFIMSYASDYCQSRFSLEQIEAMRANLNSEHLSYIVQDPPISEIDDDAQVQLISPLDSQIVQFNQATFEWSLLPGATIYVMEISPSPNFWPRLFHRTFTDNTTSVTVNNSLLNNRILYWRVRAYNEWDICQPSDNAQTGVFKTKNLSSTNDLNQAITVELSPNPVIGGLPALLAIATDETLEVSLKVTDAAGRLCQQQQVQLFAGENRIEIPTSQLSAGLYVLTLQNEKGTLLKRLAVTE